ncbi:peptidoglycan editing factor PgeF [Thiohalorhabdus sp.]|uniref:peptidoglycan editing factor PgeF n=1 Tax=Thiohalorhabdus sp. TaxID=3094134 RepID=UPI002FC2FF9C
MRTSVAGFEPHWTGPPPVRLFITTRSGGHSHPPFDGFNLAAHVGDDPEALAPNRADLRTGLGLPAEPGWLEQVHGSRVTRIDPDGPAEAEADGGVVTGTGAVAAVLTADCLPIVLARADGTGAGVAHVGWRGLAQGVVEAAVAALTSEPSELHAFLGPAIGPEAFTVGSEVRDAFTTSAFEDLLAFQPEDAGWRANLYLLAANRLKRLGLEPGGISGGGFCTYSDPERFFSYRRDGGRTGRMATLVWLEG